jgi:hypothetical protein
MPRVNVMYRGYLGLAISLFPILIYPIFAQNVSSVCYDGDFATVNATASVEINGMHPQDPLNGSAAGHYIVSTAVKEVINVTQNTSVIKQTFWLRPIQSSLHRRPISLSPGVPSYFKLRPAQA